eukprot:8269832-Karenia_brevis.AAC.1
MHGQNRWLSHQVFWCAFGDDGYADSNRAIFIPCPKTQHAHDDRLTQWAIVTIVTRRPQAWSENPLYCLDDPHVQDFHLLRSVMLGHAVEW